MICYLPFTYIPERCLSAICSALGPLTVYSPDQALVPDHMRTAADQGDIDLRPLQSPAPGGLIAAIQAFKAWADLHQGHLADVAGFFKASGDQFALMDETNPSRISTQIRNFEDPAAAKKGADPLFQAALFLSMAQDYDQQHELMRQGLGTVQTMEREMLARLSGDMDAGTGSGLNPALSRPPVDLEPGGYMTAARLEAWAQLALEDANPPLVFLTGSPAVMDHLLNLFPAAQKVAHLGIMAPGAGGSPCIGERRDGLRRLAAAWPRPDKLPGFDSGVEDGSAGLTLYVLAGIAPRTMLQRLCPSKSGDDTPDRHRAGENHTLIGLVVFA